MTPCSNPTACVRFVSLERKGANEAILILMTFCPYIPKKGNANSNDLPKYSLHLLSIHNLFWRSPVNRNPTHETLINTTLIDHIATIRQVKLAE